MKVVPLKWFLAWRATNHFNYAYGQKGFLKGSMLSCQGAKAVTVKGKSDWVDDTFLEIPMHLGDILWEASSQKQYQDAINLPWTMAGLVKLNRQAGARGVVVPGTWYQYGHDKLTMIDPPMLAITDEDIMTEAENLGKHVRSQDFGEREWQKAPEARTRTMPMPTVPRRYMRPS